MLVKQTLTDNKLFLKKKKKNSSKNSHSFSSFFLVFGWSFLGVICNF